MISRNYFREYKKVIIVSFASLTALLGYSTFEAPIQADATYEVQVRSEASGLYYGSRLSGFSIKVQANGQTGTSGPVPGKTTWEWNDIEQNGKGKLLNKWRRNENGWEKTNLYVQSNVGNFTNFNSNNWTHGGFDNWGGANQTSFRTKF